MKELRCPHCNQTFTVDESEYADLLSQVRNASFNEELQRRIAEIRKADEAEKKAADVEAMSRMKAIETDMNARIKELQQQLEAARQEHDNLLALAVAQKEKEMQKTATDNELALKQQLADKEAVIVELKAKSNNFETEKQLALTQAEQKAQSALQQLRESNAEALRQKDTTIQKLQNDAELTAAHNELQLTNLKEQHKVELQLKDDVIAQYKDFKLRQSTKMIGESLEQFCSTQYEMNVRPLLPEAEFGKDNEVIENTKGDFVFRDKVNGIESVSIMFEMKNEADDTATKHKNADFFAKLDADRKKKKCEYAVLVTMLEPDSELYNNGIYAVPCYEKMYVVRPQQFLAIIALLRQVGRSTLEVKRELAAAKERDIDVTRFEDKVEKIKSTFSGHVEKAMKRYEDSIKNIDSAIAQLTAMKENLRLWVDHLNKADSNLDDLTVKKLTWGNATMKELFEQAKQSPAIDVLPEPTD